MLGVFRRDVPCHAVKPRSDREVFEPGKLEI